jgi:hypothetical protein
MTYTAEQIKEMLASMVAGRTLPRMRTILVLEQLLKSIESKQEVMVAA